MENYVYVALLLVVFPLHGYIYQVDVLTKKMASNNALQKIMLLSDWHDFPTKISAMQHTIVSTFCVQKKQDIHLIVEDIGSDRYGLRAGNCHGIPIKCEDGLLAGFAQWCHKQGISCTNVEFRYCRVGACMPVLHGDLLTSKAIKRYGAISLDAIIDEAEVAKKSIHKNRLLAYSTQEQLLSRYNGLNGYNFYDYCSQYYADSVARKRFIEHLLISDSYIIDERIIASIVAQSNVPLLMVIAGGSHILPVKNYLIAHGYRLHTSYGYGTTLGGVPEKAPAPVLLDKFLSQSKLL